MRKGLRVLLLGAVFTVLLCTSALAVDSAKGIVTDTLKPADEVTNVALEAQKADGTPVTGGTASSDGKSVLADTEKVGMTVSNTTDGNQYLAFVLKDGSGVPTASNIVYIDQVQASGTSANFNLYPSSLASGTKYHIYLSSNETTGGNLKEVGSFEYYAPYKLGYVDDDDKITATDAQWILQMVVQKRAATDTQRLAADVDGDQKLTATDAQWLLQVVVQKRTLS